MRASNFLNFIVVLMALSGANAYGQTTTKRLIRNQLLHVKNQVIEHDIDRGATIWVYEGTVTEGLDAQIGQACTLALKFEAYAKEHKEALKSTKQDITTFHTRLIMDLRVNNKRFENMFSDSIGVCENSNKIYYINQDLRCDLEEGSSNGDTINLKMITSHKDKWVKMNMWVDQVRENSIESVSVTSDSGNIRYYMGGFMRHSDEDKAPTEKLKCEAFKLKSKI